MSTAVPPDSDRNDRLAGSTELRYNICPTLAGVLRTYLVRPGGGWQIGWAAYVKTDRRSRLDLIEDIHVLLSDHAASEEQVRLWIRAHTESTDGLLEPSVPVRHSLLAVRDAALADVRNPADSDPGRGQGT